MWVCVKGNGGWIKDKVDLFLYDVKTMDDRTHKKYTGVSNKLILRNFERLAEDGSNISVRFPIIPGVNDDAENVNRIAEFMLSHGVKQVCLLPYHRAGIEKYRSLNKVTRWRIFSPLQTKDGAD